MKHIAAAGAVVGSGSSKATSQLRNEMVTGKNEKGKGFTKRWDFLESLSSEKPLISSEERAEIYDELRKKNKLNHKQKE